MSTAPNPSHDHLADSPAVFLVSWASLEEALTLLAATPQQQSLVPQTVSALKKLSVDQPPSKTLLSILAATAFLADGSDEPVASLRGGAVT
jgi:hypothetical protein